MTSRLTKGRSGTEFATSRSRSTHAIAAFKSSGSDRIFASIRTGSWGLGPVRETRPRLFGCETPPAKLPGRANRSCYAGTVDQQCHGSELILYRRDRFPHTGLVTPHRLRGPAICSCRLIVEPLIECLHLFFRVRWKQVIDSYVRRRYQDRFGMRERVVAILWFHCEVWRYCGTSRRS
jgi:hypothetical protein